MLTSRSVSDVTLLRGRFVSRMILIDTVRSRRYYFICKSWLAAEIGDGAVVREFPTAAPERLHDKEHLFFTHTTT